MIPSFFEMADNYLATAFRTQNHNFFPAWLLRAADGASDASVWGWTATFFVSLGAFAAGLFSQLACIVMTASCYFFYARNNYHIGTLSFDILLVTLFLLCMTGAHGDFLSLDSLRRAKDGAHKRLRPIAIQRLLQLQLALTFLYTAMSKVSAGGNWLKDNPYYYLMRYPEIGVVRDFPGRAWLAQRPEVCQQLGIACLTFEVLLPFMLFIPRTRPIAITLGIAFQLMLWLTLHVPTIFLFLFPPLMLLFIPPEAIVEWIESRRERHAAQGRAVLVYDGRCGFCLASVKRVRALDLFGWVDPVDFHTQPDLSKLNPALTPQRCRAEMVLLEPNGRVSGGFHAFRRMAWHMPMLWPAVPWLYLPGMGWIGGKAYRWVAEHRYLLHRNPACASNQCAVSQTSPDPSAN
jgi:predicted DCC family thiol-disulfide oxidoreductase YuxK